MAPPAQFGLPPDRTPPKTTIRRQVLRSQPPVLVFRSSSNEPNSTFRCKFDKHRFVTCHSPLRLSHPEPGRHTLRVFAVDAAGNRDRSPALVRFKVARQKNRP
jgi:hypothetical protein